MDDGGACSVRTLTKLESLAYRERTNIIWSIARLVDPAIDYPSVWTIADTRRVPPRMPVDRAMNVIESMRAWDRMIALNERSLDQETLDEYAWLLDMDDRPRLPEDADESSLLSMLWSVDKRLAVVAINHLLLHARNGLFDPAADMPDPVHVPWDELAEGYVLTEDDY